MSNTAPAGTASAPAKGTATVVIGCKLPHGLVLEIGLPKDGKSPRSESYRAFVIKGRNSARIAGGYGITPGVPEDFANEWLKQNAHLRYVRDGLIFIVKSADAAKSEAKDRRDLKTGFEPINPLEAGPGKPPVDAAAKAAYLKQVAENPSRGRQVDELTGDAA